MIPTGLTMSPDHSLSQAISYQVVENVLETYFFSSLLNKNSLTSFSHCSFICSGKCILIQLNWQTKCNLVNLVKPLVNTDNRVKFGKSNCLSKPFAPIIYFQIFLFIQPKTEVISLFGHFAFLLKMFCPRSGLIYAGGAWTG